MATKDKLMRLLQEVRGLAEINRRHPAPKSSPLFLVQLRSHLNSNSRPRYRLSISMDARETAHFPQPVKITHLTTAASI